MKASCATSSASLAPTMRTRQREDAPLVAVVDRLAAARVAAVTAAISVDSSRVGLVGLRPPRAAAASPQSTDTPNIVSGGLTAMAEPGLPAGR